MYAAISGLISGVTNVRILIIFVCVFFFSGRAASRLSLDLLKTTGIVKVGDVHLPYNSAHTVTVPGAASAWCDTVEKFGSGKVQHVITILCLV